MEKKNHKLSFVTGIWKENPLLVSLLGMCPALAVTTSVESALGMGFLFLLVLTCSNIIVSLLRNFIPEEVRTPCFIVVIATFVTLAKMFTEAYLPELYSSLGVFLSLLVVNCVILGRAEAFASKNKPLDAFLDGLGNGIGFTIAILIIALFREALGRGMLTFGRTFPFLTALNNGELIRLYFLKGPGYDYSMSVFANPAGGFIVLGIFLAVLALIGNVKKNKAAQKAKAEALAKAAKKEEVAS